MGELLHFICPWCDSIIQIKKNEINCGIFRHAVYKSNNQQVNPHLPRLECEELIKNKLIHGCGKPFKITKDLKIEICDWC